jgi:tetratricopeptide (TPR) repeat protein
MAVADGSSRGSPNGVPPAQVAPGADASPAPASKDSAVEMLISQGTELRKRGDDARALDAFERAWAVSHSARALAQVALAEQALGRWLEAHQHLQEALRDTADPWIIAHRTTLSAALNEIASQLGAVEITCNVVGAEVRIDGRLIGRTPLVGSVPVLAGQSVIQVSADGYFEVARRVQADAGSLSRVDVRLIQDVAPALSGQSNGVSPVGVTPTRAEPAPEPAAVPRPALETGSAPRDIVMYTSLGLAALGVTVGATGYVIREVNVRLYNDDARCAMDRGTRRSEECKDEAAAWRSGEVAAIGGFAAAGVFGALGLYLWFNRPETPASGDVACAFDPSIALRCGGRF